PPRARLQSRQSTQGPLQRAPGQSLAAKSPSPFAAAIPAALPTPPDLPPQPPPLPQGPLLKFLREPKAWADRRCFRRAFKPDGNIAGKGDPCRAAPLGTFFNATPSGAKGMGRPE